MSLISYINDVRGCGIFKFPRKPDIPATINSSEYHRNHKASSYLLCNELIAALFSRGEEGNNFATK